MAQRVIGGNLDKHNWDAVRILDPHLDQSPRLSGKPAQNTNAGAASRSCSA